ncbi:MAG: hypothetical protein H0X41_03310 [Chitinophagaceae bacterium]|nr:hypothetical protein [Chitinophagaceae bacterium]
MKLQFLFLLVIFITAPLIWLLPRRFTGNIMLAATLIVYAWVAPGSVLLLLAGALLQWLVWDPASQKSRIGKWLPVIIPLIPLVIYKVGFTYSNWLIPLGLSYYAFRQIHVAFEYYKGTMRRPSLVEYLEYLLFLPVVLVGPIHRMPEFQRSLRRHKWNPLLISEGLERILYGMVKISFLGNFVFSVLLKQLTENTTLLFPKLYVEVVAFTGNAYFQFAGFSDLAIGAGLLWGIRIMENFNAPFLATNMQMFWQRWHISLSGWCRDYIFQPVAGFTRNRWLALIVSMLVLALWHEISIRYVVWGALQAILILLTVRLRKLLPRLSLFINENFVGRWLGRIWVFHLFAFSCTIIASESIESLESVFKKLF